MKRIIILAICLLSGITASAQKWSVSTNVVDWINFGTVNVEASAAVAREVTLHASYRFNPWTYNVGEVEQLQNRHHTANMGVRWWPWHIYSGWWLGAGLQYQEYNRGGVLSRESEEGDAYGADLAAGYTLMINRHLNLEFGLSLWGGWTDYTRYACTSCGKIVQDGEKWFARPNNLKVAVTWIF